MNAPERVYLKANLKGDMWWLDNEGTEYIRADLYDAAKARIAELEQALSRSNQAECSALEARIQVLEAAVRRQVENIERWLETGEPASAEESKSIYEQLKGCDSMTARLDIRESRIRELEAAQEWQPIGTAPHGINVLLAYWDEFTSQWKVEVGMASWGWRRNGVSNISLHGHATHWMLLPNPPAAECSSHD